MPSPSTIAVPTLATLICHLAAAVPRRSRWRFVELLLGAAVTTRGHVTQAITVAGHSRRWTTYFWFIDYGRWSWLAVWEALLDVLRRHVAPTVWHVILDDTLVERRSEKAPESRIHFNHAAKGNRPRYLRGQGWVCLAAVVENGFRVGAVPLMLRLERATGNRGKLDIGRMMIRVLGNRLGAVRLLADAWYMRGRLILEAVRRGHCVIGQVRRDTALYEPPPPRPAGKRGAPRKYGDRLTAEKVAALKVHRTAQLMYGGLEIVRYRTCIARARFLKGAPVRAIWVELERPDQCKGSTKTRLLLCTDPAIPAIDVIRAYAKRWSVEPLFHALKHRWGLRDTWQRSRRALMRWVTILSAGYAINQILAFSDLALLGDLARPDPWRHPAEITDGTVRAGLDRLLRKVGVAGVVDPNSPEIRRRDRPPPRLTADPLRQAA